MYTYIYTHVYIYMYTRKRAGVTCGNGQGAQRPRDWRDG